ncbi:MAG: hypothetical protein IJ491_06315 [Clostridia bacterium]|nr:hypothetical protein [Clostridia bacterium]
MKKVYSNIFFTLIAIMMAVYLTCDIFSLWDSRPLKFAVSALITLFGLRLINKKESRFVAAGLIFTLAADVFLVLLNKYIYGVILFIVAQLFYAVYLTCLSNKVVFKELLKRIIPAIICSVAFYLFGFGENIVVPAAYAVCIGVNIAHAVELQVQKPCRKHLLLAVGFIIFVCGDICVGLRHLPPDIITENVASVLYLITWISYPPSQIMVLASTGIFSPSLCKTKPIS